MKNKGNKIEFAKNKIIILLEKYHININTLKIVMVYFLISIIWINVSDQILILKFRENLSLHTYKAYFFIIVTSLILYKLIKYYFTQIQKNQIEVRDSKEIQELALSFSDGAIWDWNLETNKLNSMTSWRELFGNYENNIDMMEVLKILLHPDDYERFLEEISEFIKNKPTSLFESQARMKSKNGKYKWILSRGKAILNNDGQVVRMIGIDIDITEHKEITQKIEQNEEKYGSLIQFLPDAFFVHKERKVVFANLEAIKLLGYKKEEDLIGKSIFSLIHDSYHEVMIERFKSLRDNSNEIVPMIQEKMITADGKVIDVEATSTSFTFEGEKAIISVFRDITDRKNKELEIIKLSRAIKQSPSIVIMTDVEGNIEYANPKFTEISGYELSELRGENFRILNSDEQSEEFYKEVKKAMDYGKVWKGEFCSKGKNGELFWAYATIAPLRDLDEKVIGYITVKQDINDRKIMEKKLIQNNEDLSEMVEKLKETHSQLIQQEQLAGIGQLAAGIAHEINNPLGFVNSNFKTLSEYIEEYKEMFKLYNDLKNENLANNYEKNKELLDKIVKIEEEKDFEYIHEDIDALLSDSNEGLERVEKIIRGLRLFSRVDQLNEFEGYDLNEGIKTTLIVAKNEIKYNAEVQVSYGDLPIIRAMGGQINQVLLNIIINATYAIKAKESEEFGLIKICTYKDENHVYVKIEDNGIGTSKENINKIFNPFFTTKPVGEGTGLGLGIAYEIIVNKHKGKIWVESELNEGASFYIKLPINQQENL